MNGKRSRVLPIILALVLLMGLFSGCGKDLAASTAPQTGEALETTPQTESALPEFPNPEPAARYNEATAALEATPDRTVKVTIREERSVGGQTFTETNEQTARYQGLRTGAPVIHIKDSVNFEGSRAAYERVWADGTLWAKVKQARYYSQVSLNDYQKALFPAELLSPENYGSITEQEGVLVFSDARNAEDWAMPADGELREVSASAVLTDGALSVVNYEIAYGYGGSEIHTIYRFELTASVDENLRALVPESDEGWTELGNAEAAIILWRGQVALEQAKMSYLSTVEYVEADLAPYEIRCSFEDLGYEFGDTPIYRAQREWNYEYEEDEVYRSLYYYRDGEYTTLGADWEPETVALSDTQNPKKAQEMASSLAYYKLYLYPDFAGLASADLYDMGDYWMIYFSPSEELFTALRQEANDQLLKDDALMAHMARQGIMGEASGIVAFEKCTWLPVGLSLFYGEDVTNVDRETHITLERSTTIRLCDPDIYTALTGEALPAEESDQKASPLLYEVTGDGGERMYLFGTIHFGDDRTAQLPQKIYDAFDSADALAVETNNETIAAMFQEGTTSEIFRLTDGTTTQDHLSPEVYQAALLRLLLFSAYTRRSDEMKPILWYNVLNEFYSWQARGLTPSKGVDLRLLNRAREQGKEIREVESLEENYEAYANLSDGVQEMLLTSALSQSRSAVDASNRQLYERWCAGDEEGLRAVAAPPDTEVQASWTTEQRALYAEYYQMMCTNRNAAMLEVAEGYLESGDVVFFAVGTAHLLGEDGLVDALREAGYEVTVVR